MRAAILVIATRPFAHTRTAHSLCRGGTTADVQKLSEKGGLEPALPPSSRRLVSMPALSEAEGPSGRPGLDTRLPSLTSGTNRAVERDFALQEPLPYLPQCSW